MIVEVVEGVDSNPSAIMVGLPIVLGSRVAQRIAGGLVITAGARQVDGSSINTNSLG